MEYYSATKKNEIVTCMKIDGTGDHHVKQNKPDSERQILHILSHMCIIELKSNKKTRMYKGDYWEYRIFTRKGGRRDQRRMVRG
jgi:hypothetical protein